jgi:hypothetical protein
MSETTQVPDAVAAGDRQAAAQLLLCTTAPRFGGKCATRCVDFSTEGGRVAVWGSLGGTGSCFCHLPIR